MDRIAELNMAKVGQEGLPRRKKVSFPPTFTKISSAYRVFFFLIVHLTNISYILGQIIF